MVFQTVFSRFYVLPFTLMFCIIRSKFFDLYCTFADYNKRILCTSLRQSKVTKTDILCAIIQHRIRLHISLIELNPACHDVIFSPSDNSLSDGKHACPMDPSDPSDNLTFTRLPQSPSKLLAHIPN